MEFEDATRKLARDQSKIKKKSAGGIVSQKAKREAEYRKRQQERLRLEREKRQKHEAFLHKYMTSCDRALGVKSLSVEGPLLLQPTSIYGDGDKIALPPSVLQYLTEQSTNEASSSPWMFRIGVLRPDYKFPASPVLQTMQEPDDDEDDDMSDDDSSDDEDSNSKAAYVDELSHKYLSYTFAAVVEFTQEEGHVGLPVAIARALLVDGVSATRTKDPAGGGDAMETDNEEEKTPGHLAWGVFDVPSVPVEVSLVKLPKGRTCTLVPTMEAIRNGFHNLKDIKLVLEQSLIRTRATLSVGDVVHTWHRGVKFDLSVASVSPSDYDAVTCINTDMEVDIGVNEEFEREMEATKTQIPSETDTFAPGRGQVLSQTSVSQPTVPQQQQETTSLLPEPPVEQTEGVCTVQIRASGVTGRRRFLVATAKVQDLFAFCASLSKMDVHAFQLVTRFPRRVISYNEDSTTMEQAGIGPGQEMFMLERL